MSEAEAYLSTEFRNYADVLIGTGHGDTETQRRSTRAACTAGRALRRADRKRTTEPRASGRMPTCVWHRERRPRPASVYGFHVPRTLCRAFSCLRASPAARSRAARVAGAP